MNYDQLESLIKNPETENVEYKTSVSSFNNHRHSIYNYCVGIANSGGGYVIIGYNEDTKQPVGIKESFDAQKCKENIFSKTNNRLQVDIYNVINAGKNFICIKIPNRKTGEFFEHGSKAYKRVGQQLIAMDDDDKRKILLETAPDWSAQIAAGATMDDIDDDAVQKAKEGFVIKNPRLADEVKSWDKCKFLAKSKLLNHGKITNAAIILLGKKESLSLISPAVAEIQWQLRTDDNEMIDYESFYSPFILAVDKVFSKIRNLKYRYMQNDTLFPEEVDKYDSWVIREALNNCIAHQDYSMAAKIIVIEKNESLIFYNAGVSLAGTAEEIIARDIPPDKYKNKFLCDAMKEFNMIDTAGSGIRKMFIKQKDRLFPMPSYDYSNNHVKLEISGKILDIDYARLLTTHKELSLQDIILLDNITKKKQITFIALKRLRKLGYVEGRAPNIFISKNISESIGEKAKYIKNKGLDDQTIKFGIIKYLDNNKSASRREITEYLIPHLPDSLMYESKVKKIDNMLTRMKKDGKIMNYGKGASWVWKLTS
ncbi:MAG: putative DNA binding domain-containing protein [Rickettsiales bacterium]|jgi:ATP-dependent DNA helicase RecG|nr:putative DNA binding domain-containing protein [Rickettsiales bacterium]